MGPLGSRGSQRRLPRSSGWRRLPTHPLVTLSPGLEEPSLPIRLRDLRGRDVTSPRYGFAKLAAASRPDVDPSEPGAGHGAYRVARQAVRVFYGETRRRIPQGGPSLLRHMGTKLSSTASVATQSYSMSSEPRPSSQLQRKSSAVSTTVAGQEPIHGDRARQSIRSACSPQWTLENRIAAVVVDSRGLNMT